MYSLPSGQFKIIMNNTHLSKKMELDILIKPAI